MTKESNVNKELTRIGIPLDHDHASYFRDGYLFAQKLGLAIPVISDFALFKNDKLVSNMCISFRHDFGLLPKLIQEDLKRDCKEWLRAYENNK
tara:strand:- start:385 stop:663 length:279 start_codon:yes stop_codon:yes gene_type:complete